MNVIDRHRPFVEPQNSKGSLFVRRPVLAIVVNLLIVVAGLAALRDIEIREMPEIDSPVISVRTSYDGATPETVDKEITALIEGAVARTPGVKSISSTSSAGQSRITIEFETSVDINVAANDLRDAVGNIVRRLPDGVEAPTIVKADTESDAIIRLSAISSGRSIEDLTSLVNDRIVERLAAVDGVADVQVFGDREPLVRIIVDPYALAARGLTVTDLDTALRTIALDAPAGTISDQNRTLLVRADASVKSAEEIAAIPVGPSATVGDIADVVFGPAEQVTSMRLNGQVGVGMGIIRQAQSNTLEISSGVEAAVAELNGSLPDDVTVLVTSDDAVFIGHALDEVLLTLLIATAIVVAIIFIFLRSVAVTFIPAITVPIALIGTLAAMWMVGFSINILTLLALVLATGMVVDDAIIVIENISRRRAEGIGARAAAVLGTRQVFFAVISTTATLAAVFIPVSFMPGAAGRLFGEFGFVMAFAVVISTVVALTLTPMLASRLISRHAGTPKTPIGRGINAIGSGLARLYARLLDAALAAPMVVILIAGLFAGGAVFAWQFLPEELTPAEDRGFIPVSVSTPQGATVGYTEDQMRQIEALVKPLIEGGEVTNMFIMARGGGGGGFMMLSLADWEHRDRTQMEITADVNRRLSVLPGVQVFARSSNSLGVRGGGQGLRFAITGNDYGELAVEAEKLRDALNADPRFTDVTLNYDTTQPQLSINIDRARANDIGVPVDSISAIVSTLLDGRDLGEFYQGDEAITVRAEVPEGLIQDTASLDNIQIRTSGGQMVPLSSLVTLTESAVAPSLPRQDQRRSLPLTAQIAAGTDLRGGMNAVTEISSAQLPGGMSIDFAGEAAQLNETSSGVLLTFGFALLVVLLVLAAQFESFTSAFILLATVPFGLASAVYAMLLSGGSLNIYSQIGLVMLVGLMSKNGILIVEFANQLREEGRSAVDAIREACSIRLRPVMMTMLSTVLGGLPLILRDGAGSEARMALGWIIVGGLGFATISTLFLTPVVYRLVAGFSKPRTAEAERLDRELGEASVTPAPRRTSAPVRVEPKPDELPIAAE